MMHSFLSLLDTGTSHMATLCGKHRPTSQQRQRGNRPRQVILAALGLIVAQGTAAFAAELIPASRLVDWTPGTSVGVPGGIPTNRTRIIDVTQPPYNADRTGANDTTSAIQTAINSAGAGDIVYLPAGTFRVNGLIHIDTSHNNITVRGAGPALTKIDARSPNIVFSVGTGSDYMWNEPAGNNAITAGLTKGSTTLTVVNTEPFTVGQMIQISVANQTDPAAIQSGATPVFSVSGWSQLRRQMSRITAKSATTLSISPSVHYTVDPGLSAQVNHLRWQSEGVGIEGIWIDGTNGTMQVGVQFEQCFGCWVKDVKITKTANYGISFSNTLKCEIRRCEVSERKTGGSNGSGILLGHSGNSLIEDNIILGLFPAIEVNFSSTGNVVAYNVMENSVGGTLNTNHAPHNSFNLYEGNITPNIQCDGYFGSTSDDTFFRNWIHGTDKAFTLRTFMVSLNRMTRNYSFVGNTFGSIGTVGTSPYSFGNPNLGNSGFSGTASPLSGDFWDHFGVTATLTSRTSNTSGTISLLSGSASVGDYLYLWWNNDKSYHFCRISAANGNQLTWSGGSSSDLPPQGTILKVFFSSSGYQESDLDVQATTILKENFFFGTGTIPAGESIGDQQLPNSLFRSSKPDWFGELAWPAFNPRSPSSSFERIPAGFRYLNNRADPPTDVQSAPTTVRIHRGAE